MIARAIPVFIFVAITLAVGFAAAFNSIPGEWYAALAKPFFNPPNWVFAPVWTILYVMIGTAGGLVWRRAPESAAVKIWFIQLVLNGLWSILFFAMERPVFALLDILLLLAAILMFMRKAAGISRPAIWLFVPYAAWVGFATILNASIVILNR